MRSVPGQRDPGDVNHNWSGRPLVEVRDLRVHFAIVRGWLQREVGKVKAVDGVSLAVNRGRTLGLVGESGCGKTTVGRAMLRLIRASGGSVYFRGRDVFAMSAEELRRARRHMQMIFQDPVGSLNPRMKIGKIIGEPLQAHGIARGRARQELVAAVLERVGLDASCADRYPHEFSGGQRQRIGIARALALSPDFIVCDEPVSALDVSVQSQILNLLADLQQERGIAYLFIAHNLAVVEHLSDEVAVMYLGRIVEYGKTDQVFAIAKHPYTISLLSSVPEPAPHAARRRLVLWGEAPSAVNCPTGCVFHPRCWLSRQAAAEADARDTAEIDLCGRPARILRRCRDEAPPLERKRGQGFHLAACWLAT